jgi:undecaprenyl pyrophosphate phosphatase UppP
MGIIAIAGAAVLAVPDLGGASSEALSALWVGGVAALVSGVAAIWLFIRLLRAKVFHAFSFYAWAAGLAFLAWIAWGG